MDEFTDESDDKVLHRGNVEAARSASSLSVNSVTTEELEQQSVLVLRM